MSSVRPGSPSKRHATDRLGEALALKNAHESMTRDESVSDDAQPAVPTFLMGDAPDEPVTKSRDERIAEAAYFLAADRGFEPGHELEDWLAAEERVLMQEQSGTSSRS